MLDFSTFTPVEEPLSEAEWQAYLPQHALYAQRRYRYHIRMAIYREKFHPSLAAYQRLTNRQPDRFTAPAISLLEQLMAEGPAFSSARLWELLAGEADDHISPLEQLIAEDPALSSARLWELLAGTVDDIAWDDLASLSDICYKIAGCVRILQAQEKPFRSDIAHMSEEWRCMVIALTVVMEEHALFGQQMLPPLPDDASLVPYPDMAAWRKLVAGDPHAAKRQLHDLEIQQARTGLRMVFNALESMAIGRKLLFDMS
jgi:hypothetical protein